MNKFKITVIIGIFFGFFGSLLSIGTGKDLEESRLAIYTGLNNPTMRNIFLRSRKNKIKKLNLYMKAIRRGENPNTFFGEPLRLAIELNRLKIVKELIEKYGADINIDAPKYIFIPLNTAIISNTLDIIEYLINHGADINERATFYTPPKSLRLMTWEQFVNEYGYYYPNYIDENQDKNIDQATSFLTPLELIIIELIKYEYPKTTLNKWISIIRTLLCKNAQFDENVIIKYYSNYKKYLPPVILRLFDRAKELRAQTIEESTSCPMDLARIISEYAAEQIPASKEEKEDKEKGEES